MRIGCKRFICTGMTIWVTMLLLKTHHDNMGSHMVAFTSVTAWIDSPFLAQVTYTCVSISAGGKAACPATPLPGTEWRITRSELKSTSDWPKRSPRSHHSAWPNQRARRGAGSTQLQERSLSGNSYEYTQRAPQHHRAHGYPRNGDPPRRIGRKRFTYTRGKPKATHVNP